MTTSAADTTRTDPALDRNEWRNFSVFLLVVFLAQMATCGGCEARDYYRQSTLDTVCGECTTWSVRTRDCITGDGRRHVCLDGGDWATARRDDSGCQADTRAFRW